MKSVLPAAERKASEAGWRDGTLRLFDPPGGRTAGHPATAHAAAAGGLLGLLLLVLGLRLGAPLGRLLGRLLLLLDLLLHELRLPRRAALIHKLLHLVDGIVVVDGLGGGEVLFCLFVLAEITVGRAAHLERLGRVGVELERLVAVADRRGWLLLLEEGLGALRVDQRRGHQLDDAREGLNRFGKLAAGGGLGGSHLELARLLHVGVRDLTARRRAHGLRRVGVGLHQVGVGLLRLVGLVGLLVGRVVLVTVLVLVAVLVRVPAAGLV